MNFCVSDSKSCCAKPPKLDFANILVVGVCKTQTTTKWWANVPSLRGHPRGVNDDEHSVVLVVVIVVVCFFWGAYDLGLACRSSFSPSLLSPLRPWIITFSFVFYVSSKRPLLIICWILFVQLALLCFLILSLFLFIQFVSLSFSFLPFILFNLFHVLRRSSLARYSHS